MKKAPAPRVARAASAPVDETMRRLDAAYPDPVCALTHRSPLELLVATILSAQCTDVRVNMVTPELFKKFPDARALADAPEGALEEVIRSTGFFNAKARSIRGAARALVNEHGGKVPRTMEALHALPGVGRKTANVVLGNIWNEPDGVVVDTHVGRLSRRLGWTKETDPEKVELQLNKKVPRSRWVWISHALIEHGRQICLARKPFCDRCPLEDICPKKGVEPPRPRKKP
ncbi:MAG: endonuclease III [Thermoanaerobaculia bacterium]